jgi:hypothetical protein
MMEEGRRKKEEGRIKKGYWVSGSAALSSRS